MKKITTFSLCLFALLLYPAFSDDSDSLNLHEQPIHNEWVVDIVSAEIIYPSVNSKIGDGDRLRIRVAKKLCHLSNIITSFHTTSNHPDIHMLVGRKLDAIFFGSAVKVEVLRVVPIHLGREVHINLSWFDTDKLIEILKGEEEISLYLLDGDTFKASDFFTTLENAWSLNGFESAMRRAQEKCEKL